MSTTKMGTKFKRGTKWVPPRFSIFDYFYSFFSWSGNVNVRFSAW